MILFTDKGERVPKFSDVYKTDEGVSRVAKHGWKEARTWRPGFVVTRVNNSYRIREIPESSRAVIGGSVYQLRAWDLLQPAIEGERRWPTIAAVEVYLRTVYGSVQ